jgi:GAF domain-containing protein
MHRLLQRQLRRHFGSTAEIPPEWGQFVAAVDNAYTQSDADRNLLERSLDLTSEELFERSRLIQQQFSDEQEKNQLIEAQSRALLEVVQSVALGNMDVEVAIPEGVEVLSELAVGIEMMIGDLRQMLAEQENARQIIGRALEQTETLYVGSDRVLRSQSTEDVLNALIRSTALQFFDWSGILLFDTPLSLGEMPTVITVAAVLIQGSEITGEALGTRINFENFPLSTQISREVSLLISDANTAPSLDADLRSDLINERNVLSIGIWPLTTGDQWLGFVSGQSHRTIDLDENDQRQINSLVDQAAIVLHGIGLYEQAQSALSEAEETHQLYLRKRWEEYTERGEGRLLFEPQVFTGRDETIGEKETQPQKDVETTDIESVLDIPIAIRGQSIGNLEIEIPEGNRQLSPEQQALVDNITQQMGLALENLRLIEETQRSASREQVIREITAKIRETLDIETVLKTATTEISRSFGLAALDIQLRTKPAQESNGINRLQTEN